MNCDKCNCEISGDDIFYEIEVVKKYVNNPSVGYPETELTLCEECGESAQFDLK